MGKERSSFAGFIFAGTSRNEQPNNAWRIYRTGSSEDRKIGRSEDQNRLMTKFGRSEDENRLMTKFGSSEDENRLMIKSEGLENQTCLSDNEYC